MLLLSTWLVPGVFAEPENNPPRCPPHAFYPMTRQTPCACSILIYNKPSSPIKQYSSFTPLFAMFGVTGFTERFSFCAKCGASKFLGKEYGHSRSVTSSGMNWGGSCYASNPGEQTVTISVNCPICGTIASTSFTYTVVAEEEPEPTPDNPPNPAPNPNPGPNPGPNSPLPLPPSPANQPGLTTTSFALAPVKGQAIFTDIHGLPESEKRPQQEVESDQPKSFFKINMESMNPEISVSDISVPVGNGQLKLEIRRSYQPGEIAAKELPEYQAGFFGHSWTTNLKSRAFIVLPSDTQSGGCAFFTESGKGYEYKHDADNSNSNYFVFKHDILNSSESEIAKTSLKYDRNTDELIWTQKFGTKYYYTSWSGNSSANIEKRLLLDRIVDLNGNTIRYRYASSTFPYYPTSIEYDEDGNAGTPSNITINITYDSSGRISGVTDPMGNQWNYQYTVTDGRTLLTGVTEPQVTVYGSGNQRPQTSYAYVAAVARVGEPAIKIINNVYTLVVPTAVQTVMAINTITYPNNNVVTFNYGLDRHSSSSILTSLTTADGTVEFSQVESEDTYAPNSTQYMNRVVNRVKDINGNYWRYYFYGRSVVGLTELVYGQPQGEIYTYTMTDREFVGADAAFQYGLTSRWKHEVGASKNIALVDTYDHFGNRTHYDYLALSASNTYDYFT